MNIYPLLGVISGLVLLAVLVIFLRVARRTRGGWWALLPWAMAMTLLIMFGFATDGYRYFRLSLSGRGISGDMGVGSWGASFAVFAEQIGIILTVIFILLFPIETCLRRTKSEQDRGANALPRAAHD